MVSERARKRYYTVGEANAQVARLSELFGRVMQLRAQLKTLYHRLDEAGFAPTHEEVPKDPEELAGELARELAVELEDDDLLSILDVGDEDEDEDEDDDDDEDEDDDDEPTAPVEVPPAIERDRRIFFGMAETLKEQIEAVLATGCVIKDIEIGLVDWLASHQGREVWLCWKYGERQVAYWHETTAGFAGRRPVSELELER
jgi:hypothetical protein